jgi:beta-lactamase regulating signal transducer with metallopeptidase domain
MMGTLADAGGHAALLIVVKASVVLSVAAAASWILAAHASAATRHFVWTLAVVSLLLLPALSLVAPEWLVVVRRAPAPSGSAPVAPGTEDWWRPTTTAPSPSGQPMAAPTAAPRAAVSWVFVAGTLYAAGVVALLTVLALQHWRVRRATRRAAPVRDAEWLRLARECARTLGMRRLPQLRRSLGECVPMAVGTRRPSIVLPAIADTWTEDRRRAVLLHELAHVARYDCLTQLLACVARAVYWFHPAMWWAARRLRIERELACDDLVLAAGTEGRDYAAHLLEIAFSLGGQRAPALAVTMARSRLLEGRMMAALDHARNRRVPAAGIRLAGAAMALAGILCIAGARPTVAVPEAALIGTPVASASPRAEALADGDGTVRLKADTTDTDGTVRLKADTTGKVRLKADATEAQEGAGTWEIRPTDAEGTVHLRLSERKSSSGTNVPLAQLEGLTPAQLSGAGGPVQFRLRRDAGTFTFEGVVRNGVGAGTFSFAPDASFPAELVKRGFAKPTPAEQYQLARHDVGYAFLDELTTQGYAKPQTADLVRAGQHGVGTAYLREMGALGYRLGSIESLITLRDHGVTPAYIRDLADLGYKGLSADDLRKARDHGVTPDYVRGMREAGYASLPMEQFVNARDHGVTPEFVRGLAESGHRNLPLDQLIRVRDHGVTPEYVRDMRQLGHAPSLDGLIQARDHGVTPEYARELVALGYKESLDSLIRLRDHGVTPSYVREVKALGYDRLTADDLITLRDHGLTPDRIRAANAKTGTRNSVDSLKSLASRGEL